MESTTEPCEKSLCWRSFLCSSLILAMSAGCGGKILAASLAAVAAAEKPLASSWCCNDTRQKGIMRVNGRLPSTERKCFSNSNCHVHDAVRERLFGGRVHTTEVPRAEAQCDRADLGASVHSPPRFDAREQASSEHGRAWQHPSPCVLARCGIAKVEAYLQR